MPDNIFINSNKLGVLNSLDSYNVHDSIDYKVNDYKKNDMEVPVDEHGNYHEDFIDEAISMDMEFINDVISAFHSGKFNGGNVRIKDVLTSHEYQKLFGSAVELFMAGTLPAQTHIVDTLFKKIPYSGHSQTVNIRTYGGVMIEEIPEAGNYPETSAAVSDQVFRTSLDIKKYGAKVAATKEMIESDNWGILAFTLAELKKAVDKYKERQAITLFNEMSGYTLKDNADASNAELGSFTGRGIDGSFNGAAGVDDYMEMIAWHQARGYNPDVLVMHPFAWIAFQRDTDLREVFLGGNVKYSPNGSGAPGWGSPFGAFGQPYNLYGSGIPSAANAGSASYSPESIFGKLGVAPYNFPNLTPFGATYQLEPKNMGGPLTVLVTPYVPYFKISTGSAAGKFATNTILVDSERCGLILEKEAPVLEEWKDIEREVDFVKIRTRYGMNLQEQGRGVVVARNQVLDRTFTFDNVNSVSLSAIDTTTNRI